jgi:hypothetical protein
MALFPLGILSAAGAGGAAFESDYELIESVILGSTQASIVFSNLGTYSSTYKHLQVRGVTRTTRPSPNVNDVLHLTMNGDDGANYAWHELRGGDGSVSSGAGSSQNYIRFSISHVSQNTANLFSPVVADILDFSSTTKNTTVRSLSGMKAVDGSASQNFIDVRSGFWNNTAAVTSLTFKSFGTGFEIGTRLSLYGIRG